MTTHNVSLASPPYPLTVKPGDEILVNAQFDYLGPEVTGVRAHIFLYSKTLLDPHNEKVAGESAPFNLEAVDEIPKTYIVPPVVLKLPLTGLPPGLLYGLGVKIVNLPGPDWVAFVGANDPPYNTWIINVEEFLPTITNLVIVSYSEV